MQGQATKSNGATTNTQAQAKPAGSTFDLVRKVGEVDGKAQWQKYGTLFMRANGSGGVVYLKVGEEELEIAAYPRRSRK